MPPGVLQSGTVTLPGVMFIRVYLFLAAAASRGLLESASQDPEDCGLADLTIGSQGAIAAYRSAILRF